MRGANPRRIKQSPTLGLPLSTAASLLIAGPQLSEPHVLASVQPSNVSGRSRSIAPGTIKAEPDSRRPALPRNSPTTKPIIQLAFIPPSLTKHSVCYPTQHTTGPKIRSMRAQNGRVDFGNNVQSTDGGKSKVCHTTYKSVCKQGAHLISLGHQHWPV